MSESFTKTYKWPIAINPCVLQLYHANRKDSVPALSCSHMFSLSVPGTL